MIFLPSTMYMPFWSWSKEGFINIPLRSYVRLFGMDDCVPLMCSIPVDSSSSILGAKSAQACTLSYFSLLPWGTLSVHVTAPEPLKKGINPTSMSSGSVTRTVSVPKFLHHPNAKSPTRVKPSGRSIEVILELLKKA